jgi:hypothetical protein
MNFGRSKFEIRHFQKVRENSDFVGVQLAVRVVLAGDEVLRHFVKRNLTFRNVQIRFGQMSRGKVKVFPNEIAYSLKDNIFIVLKTNLICKS